MAKALGQEPVQVPHWMQAFTISRIVAKESMTGSGTISDSGLISIIWAWFMAPPLLLMIVSVL
jgi:hypothetical protein